ncbi:MAG: glucokinase [Erythrobacter sp.]|uniref:glucokinase n=1 Tax=Erythrobacter sp. TaxID=1042 RepID=UPI002631C274|nr:glucokinase [Erythrobacter sp.]MDJ0978700.1 glucokinase [Erythrobacter sp.]
MEVSRQIVAVDIGGTHARFGIATFEPDGAITLGKVRTLKTRDYRALEDAFSAYRSGLGDALPRAASIAMAGLVEGDVIPFTNNQWTLHRKHLKNEFDFERCHVVNDFEAVAHAVSQAASDQFLHLAGPSGDLPRFGTVSVVGPGTGLGVAHFHRERDGRALVQSTEGGHASFAPVDRFERALYERLKAHFGRVSTERALCGPAIAEYYEVLCELEGLAAPRKEEIEIWRTGLTGEDPLAAKSIGRFCDALGSVTGDIALVHGARGVVIAGGLGSRLRAALPASNFHSRFTDKGRFTPHMEGLPVKLVTLAEPGLVGAAVAYARASQR